MNEIRFEQLKNKSLNRRAFEKRITEVQAYDEKDKQNIEKIVVESLPESAVDVLFVWEKQFFYGAYELVVSYNTQGAEQ